MWPFLVSAWRAGLRSRSIQGILVLGVLLVGVAYLVRIVFSAPAAHGGAGRRLVRPCAITLILFALFWVQELVGREIERRTVLFSLTYPVARGQLHPVGRYLGVTRAARPLPRRCSAMLLWAVVLTHRRRLSAGFAIAGRPALLAHGVRPVGRCRGGGGLRPLAGDLFHGADAAAGPRPGLRGRRARAWARWPSTWPRAPMATRP
jgi:hypothetical protein